MKGLVHIVRTSILSEMGNQGGIFLDTMILICNPHSSFHNCPNNVLLKTVQFSITIERNNWHDWQDQISQHV